MVIAGDRLKPIAPENTHPQILKAFSVTLHEDYRSTIAFSVRLWKYKKPAEVRKVK
jgi:hypothetical protein